MWWKYFQAAQLHGCIGLQSVDLARVHMHVNLFGISCAATVEEIYFQANQRGFKSRRQDILLSESHDIMTPGGFLRSDLIDAKYWLAAGISAAILSC